MPDRYGNGGEPRLRTLATTELTEPEISLIRALMTDAFGSDEDERFTDDDWGHALGGTHFVLELGGEIVSHASVVERAKSRSTAGRSGPGTSRRSRPRRIARGTGSGRS